MGVERPVEDEGHQLDELGAVGDRSERQAAARSGDRRPGSPLQAQTFDEQSRADLLDAATRSSTIRRSLSLSASPAG